MSGTKISQLPTAITPSATDLFPVVQSDVGPITRAITLAALRLAIFTNNTQATFGLNNTSAGSNETAGFTLDIGGARKANITARRIGTSPQGLLTISLADAAGTMQELVSIQNGYTQFNHPTVHLAEAASGVAAKFQGRASDNISVLQLTNRAGTSEYARITGSLDKMALRVGANTNVELSSTATEFLLPTRFVSDVIFRAQGGSEGGEITLERPASGTTLAGSVSIDIVSNHFRVFENGGDYRGFTVDLATCGSHSILWHSGNLTPGDYVKRDGTLAMTGLLTLSGNPSSALHAAPKQYVDLRAPIASPTFTGTPAAPTAGADTNSTQLATTAFVVGQAGSATPLMNSSAAVGTSLRFARQDHVHPVDTSRAPVANPTFTGTVTLGGAPSSALHAATKAYVDSVAAGGGLPTTGGTLSGALVVSTTANAEIYLDKAVGSFVNRIHGRTAGSNRWMLDLGNNDAESGGNLGSHYRLTRFDDASASLGTSFQIARHSGAMDLYGSLALRPGGTGGTNNTYLHMVKAAGNYENAILGYGAGSMRWALVMGDGSTESGGNSGSLLSIHAYNDAGAYAATPLQINRADYNAIFTAQVSVGYTYHRATGTTGGGYLLLQKPSAFLSGDVQVDLWGNNFRVYERGGTFRGVSVDLTACAGGSDSQLWHSSNLTPNDYLRRDGGNLLTGNLQFDGVGHSLVYMNKEAGAYVNRIHGQRGGVHRWYMDLGDSGTESGGDTGSDFQLVRNTDAGVGYQAMSINRASGNTDFYGAVIARNYLQVTSPSGSASMYIDKGGSGQTSRLQGRSGGVDRWALDLGNSDAEGGSNTGSHLAIHRYNNAGGYLDTPLVINRATGEATFFSTVYVGAPTAGGHAVTKAHLDARLHDTWLATTTPSGSPTYIEFALDAAYDEFDFRFLGTGSSADANLVFQVSTNGGATWVSGATDYAWGYYTSLPPNYGGAVAASGAVMTLTNKASNQLRGKLLFAPGSDTVISRYSCESSGIVSTNSWEGATFHGGIGSAGRPNRIRFYWTSGTWANGGKIIMKGLQG